MKLVVFSHKVCWESKDSPTGWATDGGFAMHMDYLSKLFDETRIVVPVDTPKPKGEVFFKNKNITIVPLKLTKGKGILGKIRVILTFILSSFKFIQEVLKADAVHAPIPSNFGTFGFLLAHLFNKPLYIRHCGNWYVQKTVAERFWKWYMEKFAGGKKVFLATGGGFEVPSKINKNIKWIFSSSMTIDEINHISISGRDWEDSSKIRLCIVCRQEKKKGTGILIETVNLLKSKGINLSLDVVGEGDELENYKKYVAEHKLENLITFHGKLNHEGVINILKNAHVFCYPTSASEGFPKVVLEAMSQGLIILTTPVSVLANLIPENNCGFLLENTSPELLAKYIEEIYFNLPKYKSMSESAVYGSKKYTLENWTTEIAAHLESAWKVKLNKVI